MTFDVRKQPITLNPTTTALVIIDMQGGVLSGHSEPRSPQEVARRAEELLDAVRDAGGLPVLVRTTFLADNSDSLTWTLPVDAHRPAPRRPEGWDVLAPAFAPLPTEPVVEKKGTNAFHGTGLDLQLRRHGVETVIICGISTSGGVEGTARAAFDHGYAVVVDEEACAAHDVDEHAWSVDRVFPGIARVRDHATVLASLRGEV